MNRGMTLIELATAGFIIGILAIASVQLFTMLSRMALKIESMGEQEQVRSYLRNSMECDVIPNCPSGRSIDVYSKTGDLLIASDGSTRFARRHSIRARCTNEGRLTIEVGAPVKREIEWRSLFKGESPCDNPFENVAQRRHLPGIQTSIPAREIFVDDIHSFLGIR